jgi:hypothetical protein
MDHQAKPGTDSCLSMSEGSERRAQHSDMPRRQSQREEIKVAGRLVRSLLLAVKPSYLVDCLSVVFFWRSVRTPRLR